MQPQSVHRATVNFSGHVQGVGFRYTVMQIARGYEVSGFVQNQMDGRVLLEAEGQSEEVEAFITAISDRMIGYVRKTERQVESGPRRHSGFTIR